VLDDEKRAKGREIPAARALMGVLAMSVRLALRRGLAMNGMQMIAKMRLIK
jgi:hypothetical protein